MLLLGGKLGIAAGYFLQAFVRFIGSETVKGGYILIIE